MRSALIINVVAADNANNLIIVYLIKLLRITIIEPILTNELPFEHQKKTTKTSDSCFFFFKRKNRKHSTWLYLNLINCVHNYIKLQKQEAKRRTQKQAVFEGLK